MWRKISNEFLKLLLVIFVANISSFAYAFNQYNRYSSVEYYEYSLIPSYLSHLKNIIQNSLGNFPGSNEMVLERILSSIFASAGLFLIVLVICILIGIGLGFLGTSNSPPRVRPWLTVLSSFAYSLPAFFLGSIIITATILYLIWSGSGQSSPIPIQGFGWDAHLIYPVIVLAFRPTLQIAQITANAIATELSKQYVMAARSLGYTWRDMHIKAVLRNIIVNISLAITSNARMLIGQMVIIEWMFRWPGLSRLLILVMRIGGSHLSDASYLGYFPPLVSSVVTIFAIVIYGSSIIHKIITLYFDPRMKGELSQ